MMEKWLTTYNSEASIALAEIPQLEYAQFYEQLCARLKENDYHVANYFGATTSEGLQLYCILLRDSTAEVFICSHLYDYYCEQPLESIAALHPSLHVFEREISELHGVRFENSPWDKPLRTPHNRHNRLSDIDSYPFYHIESDSLHEVNVGPIHAGIIEPGAFRFICNGEIVLHLEIALGYQHRGLEQLMTSTNNSLRQTTLAESIAGDSAVAHSTAYVSAIEKLTNTTPTASLNTERAVALELERIAMHIADTGALCMDIGYQLGQVACEALRTIVINTTQLWCGNRFGKGIIRPHGTHYPLTEQIKTTMRSNLLQVQKRYTEVRNNLKVTPSVLARMEDCGVLNQSQIYRIGVVGMAARASGVPRDIRATHPWGAFKETIKHQTICKEQGDVMARAMQRSREVLQSVDYIIEVIEQATPSSEAPTYPTNLPANTLSFSLVEGWRGEICHTVITNSEGKISHYKIKDPSMHNWLALALAVRSEGISDFPICNKSFNLSYCGHDL